MNSSSGDLQNLCRLKITFFLEAEIINFTLWYHNYSNYSCSLVFVLVNE